MVKPAKHHQTTFLLLLPLQLVVNWHLGCQQGVGTHMLALLWSDVGASNASLSIINDQHKDQNGWWSPVFWSDPEQVQPVSVFVLERNGPKPAPEAGRREVSHFSARGASRSGFHVLRWCVNSGSHLCAYMLGAFYQVPPGLWLDHMVLQRGRMLVVWDSLHMLGGGGGSIIGHALVHHCSRYAYQNVLKKKICILWMSTWRQLDAKCE